MSYTSVPIGTSALPEDLTPIGVTAAYAHAWRHLWRFIGPLLLLIVVQVLLQIPSVLLSPPTFDDEPPNAIGGLLSFVYSVAVLIPTGFGVMLAYLKAARGQTPEVGDIFRVYRSNAWLYSIAATLLTMIVLVIGYLLLILPGVYLTVRLAFVGFLIAEDGLGPIEAMRESWARTSGHFWTLLGTGLLAIPIGIAGLLLLIIGIIPALLWIALAFATLYASITARRVP